MNLLKEALRLAPSSFGLQPWKFYLVRDPEVRKKVREEAAQQPQITDASHLFVLASKVGLSHEHVAEYVEDVKKKRGLADEDVKGYKKMMDDFVGQASKEKLDDWSARQTYIALGFLLSAAAENDIDACPMEGFVPEKMDELLGIREEGYASRALCAVGYRSSEDKTASMPKIRFDEERVLREI